jgi:hypothetical protein
MEDTDYNRFRMASRLRQLADELEAGERTPDPVINKGQRLPVAEVDDGDALRLYRYDEPARVRNADTDERLELYRLDGYNGCVDVPGAALERASALAGYLP